MKIHYFILSVMALVSCTMSNEQQDQIQNLRLYVGTYTDGDSEGIYSLSFDPATGLLDSQRLEAKIPNPSFLTVSRDGHFLYAVQETDDFDTASGGLSAFRIDPEGLHLLNSLPSEGKHPCHIATQDSMVVVSNYTGGSLAIFKTNADGSLSQGPYVIDHKIVNPDKKSHVHKAHFMGDLLYSADLGLDQLRVYHHIANEWNAMQEHTLYVQAGAGPRHFIFDDSATFLYVINELNSTIEVYKKEESQIFKFLQTISTLPPDYTGNNACADIHLSPDGQFLYASNRGHNSIAIFRIDLESGLIALVSIDALDGNWPRNFVIDPSGAYLLVANQKSNDITVYRRENDRGSLSIIQTYSIPSPVCLVFGK